jgi:hypothetical protein
MSWTFTEDADGWFRIWDETREREQERCVGRIHSERDVKLICACVDARADLDPGQGGRDEKNMA